jgi:glutathione S-transferase
MVNVTLTISSKNYSSWSLRGWLMMKFSGIPFTEHAIPPVPNFRIWSRAQADIDRICEIWRGCLQKYGGPFLFGDKICVADLMYAPVCTRFDTYDVRLDDVCSAYCARIRALPEMQEWQQAAEAEPDDIDELVAEF